MIRDHFPPRPDHRAGPLDPATFQHAEELQEDCALSFDPWRLVGMALCLASAVGVGCLVAGWLLS